MTKDEKAKLLLLGKTEREIFVIDTYSTAIDKLKTHIKEMAPYLSEEIVNDIFDLYDVVVFEIDKMNDERDYEIGSVRDAFETLVETVWDISEVLSETVEDGYGGKYEADYLPLADLVFGIKEKYEKQLPENIVKRLNVALGAEEDG